MTQKEYISASLKIIGLAILIYGGVGLTRNLSWGIYAHHRSKQPSATYIDSVPADIKKELDAKNWSDSMENRLESMINLSRIPANLVVILFGLALIKRDRWFTTFLIGKDK
jgi:hypothetical protein